MTKIICTALVASSLLILGAVCAKAEALPSYSDVMRKCGAEWRMSEARKSVEKGKGAAAWNAFRKECVTRHPYQKKQRVPSNARAA